MKAVKFNRVNIVFIFKRWNKKAEDFHFLPLQTFLALTQTEAEKQKGELMSCRHCFQHRCSCNTLMLFTTFSKNFCLCYVFCLWLLVSNYTRESLNTGCILAS